MMVIITPSLDIREVFMFNNCTHFPKFLLPQSFPFGWLHQDSKDYDVV